MSAGESTHHGASLQKEWIMEGSALMVNTWFKVEREKEAGSDRSGEIESGEGKEFSLQFYGQKLTFHTHSLTTINKYM